MSLVIQYSEARPAVHEVVLDVELESPTVIAVRAGSFRTRKKDFELTEDWFWTIPSVIPERGLVITGYLAKNRATEDVVLFVEEKEIADEEVNFNFSSSPYMELRMLFTFYIPAAITALPGLDITIYHTKPPPPRETEE